MPAGPARFVRPDHWRGDADLERPRRGKVGREDADAAMVPLLNIVCRIDPTGAADVWVRVNHVGADGVPIQEMLTRLETAWGARGQVLYPTPRDFAPYSTPRPCAGRADLAEVQTFIDVAPLLAWRAQANADLPEPMTFAAALLWRLAGHPAFAGLHMGTTVEVAATGRLQRGVGVVVVRPAAYFGHHDGLARYVRDFNCQVERTRRRASDRCKTLDAAALAPPRLAGAVLRHGLLQGAGAFGSVGLTVVRDAKVFGAPIGDVGHEDGFIAVGSIALPTEAGGRVGSITVKGPAARIARYPQFLREAIGGAGAAADLGSEGSCASGGGA
jgi:hypothetical protein